MTTTDAELNIKDVYSPQQVTRLVALQGIAELAGEILTLSPGVLIELADYVIGDDEPFDPVAEAHKAMAALRTERGDGSNAYGDGVAVVNREEGLAYDEDVPLADWERELLAVATEERVVGAVTVSDLAGFLTLPQSAILEDEDGDTWRHEPGGWMYAVGYAPRIPAEIFMDFGHGPHGEYDFVVTNPEVLS